MGNNLSRFLKLFSHRSSQSSRLCKRDRLRKYLFESLEPRNLLATLTVTNLSDVVNAADDATVFTLREALNAANATVADDTIQFAPALTAGVVPVTIQMTGATFQLNAVSTAGITTINGPGADLLSISGNGTDNGRIFFVNANANVVIRGLTIKNGIAFDTVNALSGGAISNDGTLTIEEFSLENNFARVDGGAIHNSGTLQVFGSTFRTNGANGNGGAITSSNSSTTTIVNSTFSGNRAQQNGGAIFAGSTSPTTLIHTTIVANTARSLDGANGEGGGISGNGAVEIQNSIVAGNKRGTIIAVDNDIVRLVSGIGNIVTSLSSGNLIGNAATAGGLAHRTNGNILGNNGSGVLPLSSILETTLRANRGRTMTHALLPTSPAIDKGFFNYVGTGAHVDQRGQLRPRDYPGVANASDGRDIGAFELPLGIVLANLGVNGTTIMGQAARDKSGGSVSSAGDVNGDGFDDLIIGAADHNYGGKSYVIFGGSSLPATIDLGTLGQSGQPAGITIVGQSAGDRSGRSVSSAGDVNGDGFDDLFVGADGADPAILTANSDAGKSYVIFGGSSLPTTITLSDNLGSTNPGVGGFTILGQAAKDFSGFSVSSAGDVNGDGFDDLILGAWLADPGTPVRNAAGKSYVIFGGSLLPTTIELATLGQSGQPAGFTILGQAAWDYSGRSVSRAGDVNGDGFDDLIIGAYKADPANLTAFSGAGKSYVVFGKSDWIATPTITLSDNFGAAGFTILGREAVDQSGFSVSRAGDVDGDGFDDLIIGAPSGFSGTGTNAGTGKSYVIFGKPDWSKTPTIALSDADGTANAAVKGFAIFGEAAGDYCGRSVSSAGDVNGDGFDDLVVGANSASPRFTDYRFLAGKSYVIFGGNGFTNSILPSNLGTNLPNTINGTSAAQILNGADGDDAIVGSGGADVLLGGRGNDILAVRDLTFNRIVGGNGSDTLRLDGSGLSLNLTAISDNRILGIETLDITGSGNNTLTLSYRDVLNISDESNTLIVRRNAGDVVNIGTGWTQIANENISGSNFQVYTQGQAILKVQLTALASVVNRQVFYNRSTNASFGNGTGNPINAIDATRVALLPGQASTSANVTNYIHGINGILIDANVPTSVTVADLTFATWNGIAAGGFAATAATPTLTVIAGGGVGGSTRLKIEFSNGAIVNTWLRVTLKGNVSTGLATDDVFYFGNAAGEVDRNISDVRVTASDLEKLRRSISNRSVAISSIFDIDKDGRVSASDYFALRQRMRAQVVLRRIVV